ncbi:hypothetical protein Prudu_005796, partial [Prunus dulcis]
AFLLTMLNAWQKQQPEHLPGPPLSSSGVLHSLKAGPPWLGNQLAWHYWTHELLAHRLYRYDFLANLFLVDCLRFPDRLDTLKNK